MVAPQSFVIVFRNVGLGGEKIWYFQARSCQQIWIVLTCFTLMLSVYNQDGSVVVGRQVRARARRSRIPIGAKSCRIKNGRRSAERDIIRAKRLQLRFAAFPGDRIFSLSLSLILNNKHRRARKRIRITFFSSFEIHDVQDEAPIASKADGRCQRPCATIYAIIQ